MVPHWFTVFPLEWVLARSCRIADTAFHACYALILACVRTIKWPLMNQSCVCNLCITIMYQFTVWYGCTLCMCCIACMNHIKDTRTNFGEWCRMHKNKKECLINYVYVPNFYSYLLNFGITIHLPEKEDAVQVRQYYHICHRSSENGSHYLCMMGVLVLNLVWHRMVYLDQLWKNLASRAMSDDSRLLRPSCRQHQQKLKNHRRKELGQAIKSQPWRREKSE
jgi:hypothetical protein